MPGRGDEKGSVKILHLSDNSLNSLRSHGHQHDIKIAKPLPVKCFMYSLSTVKFDIISLVTDDSASHFSAEYSVIPTADQPGTYK